MSSLYVVAVKRDFVAQHFLFGGDWGSENELHSHHYRVELQLEGSRLDQVRISGGHSGHRVRAGPSGVPLS